MNGKNQVSVAPCKTHHIDSSGTPLYSNRYDDVLSFHDVNNLKLAPVTLNGQAWHITVNGQPLYSRRFERTFGFYAGYAAVIEEGKWFHIRPNASTLYADRYSFAGNFQEGSAVVCEGDDKYFHINEQGIPLYSHRWKYCGDFREGLAVAQTENGLSSHILRDGSFLHDNLFFDLDVFHKGYARAKDKMGWHHIDRDGNPIYTERYVSVEPFYNGYARCETYDGAFIIINEKGEKERELRSGMVDHFADLSADIVGYWRTFTIAAAVELEIFEYLPANLENLAETISCATDRLLRLMKALEELSLVRNMNGMWIITPKSVFLKSNHIKSLDTAAIEYAGNLLDRWKLLPALVRGSNIKNDIFDVVAKDKQRVISHHKMLASYANHDYQNIVEHLCINSGDIVFDAGGGTGILAEFIQHLHPDCKVYLGDLPGVIDTLNFNQSIGFDLFEDWPLQADKIILARVLHDWPNDKAVAILENATSSLKDDGRIYIIEMLMSDDSPAGALCDLHLLSVTGGKERKREEYTDIANIAGLTLESILSFESLVSILSFKKENAK